MSLKGITQSKDLKQFETHAKLNLDETKTINLEQEDCVNEVKIRVHMRETRKRELIRIFRKCINAFVYHMSWLNIDIHLKLQIDSNAMKSYYI